MIEGDYNDEDEKRAKKQQNNSNNYIHLCLIVDETKKEKKQRPSAYGSEWTSKKSEELWVWVEFEHIHNELAELYAWNIRLRLRGRKRE